MIVCFTLAFLTNDYLEDAEIAHGHMDETDFGDAQSEALEALADLFGLPVKIVGNDSTSKSRPESPTSSPRDFTTKISCRNP